MAVTEHEVLDRLRTIKYPGYSRDIVSFGLVKDLKIESGFIAVRLALSTADATIPKQIEQAVQAVLESLPGVQEAAVQVDVTQAPLPPSTSGVGPNSPSPGASQAPIPGVKQIIAVASGKGGVGKSTVAANLALALRGPEATNRVGLCDCDIYGPSIALMFGSHERPFLADDGRIVPVERYGVNLMSMGFLLEDTTPAILRGPMVTKYTQQFLRWVAWNHRGDLDYLVLDLPPGTGDIQLTIVQTVTLSGAVIVTTPQEVALIDARKAAAMFERVNVPLLGLIENMSYFLSPESETRYDIFGKGGGLSEAARLGISLLGEIPLDLLLRQSGDMGKPLVELAPSHPVSRLFLAAAHEIKKKFSS